jgi:hypothetical protein
MGRKLQLVLFTCELCPYAKWSFNLCGKGDGIHCNYSNHELGEHTLIVLDFELAQNNGRYPDIPAFCNLPIVEGE